MDINQQQQQLTVTGWPALAGVHLSPARDVSGFHLPAAAVGVAAVGALVVGAVVVGVAVVGVAVVGVPVVGGAVVTVAFVGAAVGARVGALVGPPLSRVRPVRAALADAVSRQNAVMRAQACAQGVDKIVSRCLDAVRRRYMHD